MTTKQKATRILIAIGVAWLIWIAPMPPILSRSTVVEFRSPSQVGSAILYTEEGFQGGPATWLFIRDYARSSSKPLKLAHERNADFPLDAVWSKDGTLLAVLSANGSNGVWDCIYDFSKHRVILWGNSRSTLQDPKFLNLLNKHGGADSSFRGQSRLIKWWERFDTGDYSLDLDD